MGDVNLLRDLESTPKTTKNKKRIKMTLEDPELYAALMEECAKEEKTPPDVKFVVPKFVLTFLGRNDVRPLKKKSTKFPKAQFYCRLCDYHCDTLTVCITHIKGIHIVLTHPVGYLSSLPLRSIRIFDTPCICVDAFNSCNVH